ncbi:MAG: glycerol-3-phosphate acyltransferase [Oscillospiraceae bacterium]|jgi:glycerol-3-phosphate acyltransferase PlsY|nr:glycerol-3-phosphate acyltransferase [Oscillospiraceae bacterium]
MLVFSLVIVAAAAYLLGAVNGAIILSQTLYKQDIRQLGSGNAGLTNMYRVFGLSGAVGTFVIDTLKTAAAIILAHYWVGAQIENLIGTDGYVIARFFAGFFAMIGHVMPIWYKFRGGKGVLVCGITAFMIQPLVGALAWIVFILVVAASRYVSLGSVIAGIIAFPLWTYIFIHNQTATILAIACGILIVCMHIPNINRIIHGKEAKFGAKK